MSARTVPVTDTEIRMLALLADGHHHRRIARETGIPSEGAVSMALSRLYTRLDARNGTHAVAIAIRTGLLPQEATA